MRSFVSEHVPELAGNIHGGLYPASATAVLLNQLCSYLWFGGLIYVFLGKMICKMIGVPETHPLVKLVDDNKTYIVGGLFLLNTFSAQLIATGAFEVYLNDELIYSKLITGRVPTAEDIMSAIESHGLRLVK